MEAVLLELDPRTRQTSFPVSKLQEKERALFADCALGTNRVHELGDRGAQVEETDGVAGCRLIRQ